MEDTDSKENAAVLGNFCYKREKEEMGDKLQ
jgi:hypothetical protein